MEKRPIIHDEKTLKALFKINFQGSFDQRIRCHGCLYKGKAQNWKPYVREGRWSFGLLCPACGTKSNVLGMLNQRLLDEMMERA